MDESFTSEPDKLRVSQFNLRELHKLLSVEVDERFRSSLEQFQMKSGGASGHVHANLNADDIWKLFDTEIRETRGKWGCLCFCVARYGGWV